MKSISIKNARRFRIANYIRLIIGFIILLIVIRIYMLGMNAIAEKIKDFWEQKK